MQKQHWVKNSEMMTQNCRGAAKHFVQTLQNANKHFVLPFFLSSFLKTRVTRRSSPSLETPGVGVSWGLALELKIREGEAINVVYFVLE